MFSNKPFILIVFIFSSFSTFSFSSSDLSYKEDQILVKFSTKQGGLQRTSVERNQVLSAVDSGTVKKSFKLVPGLTIVKLPENLSVTDALSRLKNRPEILYAEPDYKLQLRFTEPNDTYWLTGRHLWALNTGYLSATEDADIDANEAWDYVTHSNFIVAVIDSGIDYNHPDLAANMWVNEVKNAEI
jgi:subtilisin family serine protease